MIILPNHSLEESERKAVKNICMELNKHLKTIERIFNYICTIFNTISEQSESTINPVVKVAVSLLVKVSNDLRCISLLSKMAYPTQALTLLSSLFEISYTMAYIDDDNLAVNWIEHNDPKKASNKNIFEIIKKGLVNFGVTEVTLDEEVSTEYKIYRQLCMAKHGNPIYQKNQGIIINDNTVLLFNGPDTSPQVFGCILCRVGNLPQVPGVIILI